MSSQKYKGQTSAPACRVIRRVGVSSFATVVLAASALIATCATASSEYRTRRMSYDADLQAYVNCNFKAAHSVALQPGDISALAAVAQGRCEREEKILKLAVQAYYVNPILSWDILRTFTNGVTKMNTEWIEQHRAKRPTTRSEHRARR